MNDFIVKASNWLWDYYLLSTALLAIVLLATHWIGQPARRMACHWATAIGLLLLAVLSALPGWSVLHMKSPPPREVVAWTEHLEPVPGPTVQIANLPQDFQPPLPPLETNPTDAIVTESTPATRIVVIDYGIFATYFVGVGSLVAILWLGVGAWQVRRLRNQATAAPDQISQTLDELATSANKPPMVGLSDRISVAVAVGLRHPMVLLPSYFAESSGPYDLRAVLAHELAHVRNRDLWLLAMVRCLMPLLWIHPLFWLWRRGLRLDQETLADAAASELTSQADYADQLVSWARTAAGIQTPRFASSVGLWESPSQLKRRVAILLDEKLTVLLNCSRKWRWCSATLLTSIAIGLSLVTLHPNTALVADELDEYLKRANERESAVEEGSQANSKSNDQTVSTLRSTEAAQESKTGRFGTGKHSVEILAIGTHGQPEQEWWDADGKLLTQVPFETRPANNISPIPNRQLVFRVHGLENSNQVRWQILPASNTSSGSVIVDGNDQPSGFFCPVFETPKVSKSVNLRVGIPQGEWATVASGTNSATGILSQGVVISDKLSDGAGNAVAVVSHTFQNTAATRCIAIDKDGKQHTAGRTRKLGAGQQHQSQWTFIDLASEDVREFALQIRSYLWIEFKDLPMQPMTSEKKPDSQQKPAVAGDKTFVTTPQERAGDSAEVANLQELVDSYQKIYLQTKALNKIRTPGGEQDKLLLAKYYLTSAKAKLFEAKQQPKEALAEYERAVQVANEYVPVVQAVYDAGRVVLDSVLQAQELRSEAKRTLQLAQRRLSSQKQSRSNVAKPPLATAPKLLYLGWQTEKSNLKDDPPPTPLWDMTGRELTAAEVAKLREQVGEFRCHHPREGGLPTLLLVFQVDDAVWQNVMPVMLTPDNKRHTEVSARTRVTAGMNLAALQPQANKLGEWPKQIDVEIKYPIENEEVFKTLDEVADVPVKLADGVSWYLDPQRASERNAAGRHQRAENKTAAVLQIKKDRADRATSYSSEVYLRNVARPLREEYVAIIKPKGQRHTIRVSAAFADKSNIDRVEFTRRRYDTAKIQDIPVRVDLMPQTKPQEVEDAKPKRLDRVTS